MIHIQSSHLVTRPPAGTEKIITENTSCGGTEGASSAQSAKEFKRRRPCIFLINTIAPIRLSIASDGTPGRLLTWISHIYLKHSSPSGNEHDPGSIASRSDAPGLNFCKLRFFLIKHGLLDPSKNTVTSVMTVSKILGDSLAMLTLQSNVGSFFNLLSQNFYYFLMLLSIVVGWQGFPEWVLINPITLCISCHAQISESDQS